MSELKLAILVAALSICVPVAIGVAVVYGGNVQQCRNLHNLMGVETYVTLSTGCLVKMDGRWVSGDSAVTNTREVTIK
jgi:hypothetical protein